MNIASLAESLFPKPLFPRSRILETVIVLAAVVIAVVSARDFAWGANDKSRLATVECLVDYHTFAIDRSTWFAQTCDKIRPHPDGPFFSDKPPVMALLLAVPYQGMQSVFGVRAAEHKEVFCYLLTLLSSGVAYVAAVWCVFRLGRVVGLSPGWAAALTASSALATIAPVYARHVNSSLPLLAVALAVLLNVTTLTPSSGRVAGRLLLMGTLAGFAYALEQPTGGLLLAVPAAGWAFQRLPAARVETVCFGLWRLGVWLLYAALSNNYGGGACCSIRWFVPLLAPAAYWLALALRDLPQLRMDFIVLSGWGAILAAYFWVYGPFGAFDYQPSFPYFFWSVQAAGFFIWLICRAAVPRGTAPLR